MSMFNGYPAIRIEYWRRNNEQRGKKRYAWVFIPHIVEIIENADTLSLWHLTTVKTTYYIDEDEGQRIVALLDAVREDGRSRDFTQQGQREFNESQDIPERSQGFTLSERTIDAMVEAAQEDVTNRHLRTDGMVTIRGDRVYQGPNGELTVEHYPEVEIDTSCPGLEIVPTTLQESIEFAQLAQEYLNNSPRQTLTLDQVYTEHHTRVEAERREEGIRQALDRNDTYRRSQGMSEEEIQRLRQEDLRSGNWMVDLESYTRP